MSMSDVLELLETAMTDPGSYKSGEYLREHVLAHARHVVTKDRSGLVTALQEWLNTRSEPRTMIAVTVARELGLKEMKSEIEILRREVQAGKVFPHFYIDNIDNALNALA
jgi:hypothetical protein